MKTALIALFSSRRQLLDSPEIHRLCLVSRRSRTFAALVCVTSFVVLLVTVLFYRVIPFSWVPGIVFASFSVFVLSAMTASRFGRLCSAETDIEYRANITHLCASQPKCLEYYDTVKRSGRPFTRLDLEVLGTIYLREGRSAHHGDAKR